MAWSGMFLLGADGRLHSRPCLTSLGFGLYLASRRPSDFSLLGRFFPEGSFFHIWCSRVVAFFISLSRSLFLYFFGVKAWGFGFTVYDDMHWAEGKYQAFWWDGQLGDSTEMGGEAFCFV